MSRWFVEKSGTGIEKSGTGIEKSGTGIEKSGTGIEKSGTGIRKGFLACSIAALAFTSQIGASENLGPTGALQLVVDDDTIAVSWIIDGSVFSGVASLSGSFANLVLTEVGLMNDDSKSLIARSGTGIEVAGSGTGIEIAGSGTGIEVAGSGTGIEVAGSGTGIEIAGSGTGTEVAGSGTGIEIAGSGTGAEVAGSGTGGDTDYYSSSSMTLIAGSGTGNETISITLPAGTGMQMEVSLGCESASVSIHDASYVEIVTFHNVPVIGSTGLCTGGDSAVKGKGNLRRNARGGTQ
jgi:hypothetical protein